MEKLRFSISIDAPRESVWKVLWDDKTYRDWTKGFSPGSYAVSDWEEGSKIQFLNGAGGGMYSVIEKKIPFELMTFKHIGEVKNGEEQPPSRDAEWYGSCESYMLTEKDGGTELVSETDVIEEFKGFMEANFPAALERVKELSEAMNS